MNIVNEFQTNYIVLNRIHEANSAAIAIRDSLGPDTDSLNTTYTPVLYLQNTAWETMKSTGLTTNMDYETLLRISQVYSIQELYVRFGFQLVENQLFQATYLSALGKTEDDISDEMILENIKLFLSLEESLIGALTGGIETLGKEGIVPTIDTEIFESETASDSTTADGS